MKHLSILFISLCFLTFGQIQAQNANATIPLDSKVIKGTLPNGLTYYVRQNKKPENKIELRLAVNAGSILEADDQQGLAHFMEHMNFNGLKNFPANELVSYLESIGVEFGADLNAYTGFDETVYILPVPSDDKQKIEKGFTILADWSQNALLEEKEIDKERGVVLEESRLGKGADDRMMQKWFPRLLAGSPYAERLPIGKDEILKNFKYDVLRRFHKDWYRPNLQAVCVVGDIEPNEAIRLIEKYFSGFTNPANPKPRVPIFSVPKRTQSETMVLSDAEAAFTTIMLNGNARLAEPIKTEKDYRNSLMQRLFNMMLNQRLEEIKNGPNPPFVFANAGIEDMWVRGYESFTATAISGGKEINRAVESIVGVLMRVKKFGFTQGELDRAKAAMMSQYEKAFNEKNKTESGKLVMEYVYHYLQEEAAPGIDWEYNYVTKNMKGLSLKEVNAFNKYIDIDDKYFCTITSKVDPNLPTVSAVNNVIAKALKAPVKPYTEKAIANKLLDKVPTPGRITNTSNNGNLGTVQFTLSNGAKVTVKKTTFKDDEILLQAARYGGSSVYAGSDYESAEYSNNIVEEMGFGKFSNMDLQKFLTGKNVRVSTIVEPYTESIMANCDKKNLKTMFELIYLMCTAPRKDAEAFSSFVSRQKQALDGARLDPNNVFADSSKFLMYQKHPRSREIPDPSTFDKINLDNGIQFYKERFSNLNGMEFFIVGSVDPNGIKQLLETYIASIGNGSAITNKYKSLGMIPAPGNNEFVLKMGKEPKALLAHNMYKDMPYNADDNFALQQINAIINIKITEQLREAMSVIYSGGLGGGIQKYPEERFMVQTFLPCGPENAKKADDAFWNIIDEVCKPGGITELDWTKAKNTTIQNNKQRLQTNNYWVQTLRSNTMNGVDLNRILTVEERLNKLNPEVLTKIAQKYYRGLNIYKAILLPE